MKPERLAEIRMRARAVKLTFGITGEPLPELLAHIDTLTADNKKLREALEEIKAHHQCGDCPEYTINHGRCCTPTIAMVDKALENTSETTSEDEIGAIRIDNLTKEVAMMRGQLTPLDGEAALKQALKHPNHET